MNRTKFLEMLRTQYGYNGADNKIEVKSFIDNLAISETNPVEIVADLDSIFAVKTKKVIVSAIADQNEQVEYAIGNPEQDDSEVESGTSAALAAAARGEGTGETPGGGGEASASGRVPVRSKASSIRKVEGAPYIAKFMNKMKDYNRKAANPEWVRDADGGFKKTAEFRDADTAAYCGAWVRYAVCKNIPYSQRQNDIDIIGKAATESVNIYGGALVPAEFSDQIIELRDRYGAARQAIGITKMNSETRLIPRVGSDFSMTWDTEANTISDQSQPTFAPVTLTARKLTRNPYHLKRVD